MNLESGHMYWIFLLVMLIIGITLIVVNFQIDKQLDNCKPAVDNKVRHSNKGILIIGIIALAFSLSNAICMWKNWDNSVTPTIANEIYIGFMLVISIILIVLGTIVKDVNCKPPVSVEPSTIVISAGSIMLTISIIYFIINFGGVEKLKGYLPAKSSKFG